MQQANKYFSGRLSSLGAPIESPLFATYGEGSSFLAIPTKRNTTHQDVNSKQFNGFLDFKQVLLPHIVEALKKGGEESVPASLLPSDAQWNALNQLRIHSGAPERTEKGIEKLMQYYAQLCWLEEKFTFETTIAAPFAWYEAFYVKKFVETTCLQYEKAAVIWNLGALYSQLGTIQCLWTLDGLKAAAVFFQKAAGAFIFCRDTLFPRVQVKLDQSADLSDASLTAVAELMLAQAAECFYLKAEFDATSSPVTSQIAAQAADYYDIAYKAARVNNTMGKTRFPKIWQANMDVKKMQLGAIAHYHCPNQLSAESYVGERQARLKLAKDYAQQALDKCVSKDAFLPHELRNSVNKTLDMISSALDEIDQANFDDFHQTVLSSNQLKPLKRPPQTLVGSVNIVMGNSCGSVLDGVYEGWLNDIFDSVIGIMCMQSGSPSGIPNPSNLPDRNNLAPSFSRRMSQPVGTDERYGATQELVTSMRSQASSRRASQTVKQSPQDLAEVKQFAFDINEVSTKRIEQLQVLEQKLKPFVDLDVQNLKLGVKKAQTSNSFGIMKLAKQLLNLYSQCYHQNGGRDLQSEIQELVQQLLSLGNSDIVVAWVSKSSSYQLGNNELSSLSTEVSDLEMFAETEGFAELFPLYTSQSEFQWTEEKIKAVIPCLDDETAQQQKNLQSLVNSIMNDTGIATDKTDTEHLAANIVKVLNEVIELAACASQANQSIQTELSCMKDFKTKWSCSSAQLLDLLAAAGGSQVQSYDNNIKGGVAIVTRQCLYLSSACEKAVSEAGKVLELTSHFRSDVCADAIAVVKLQEYVLFQLQDSEKIVNVFEDQLNKWQDWHSASEKVLEKLKACFTLQSKEVRRSGSSRRNQEVLAGDVSETKLFKRAVDRQMELEKESVDNAYKISNLTINQVQSSVKEKSSRAKMLRNISMTASAMQKQAEAIKSDQRSLVTNKELQALRNGLLGQMKAISVQHRQVTQKIVPEVNAYSRRSSEVVSLAKDKLKQFVKKRPSMQAEALVTKPNIDFNTQRLQQLMRENNQLKHRLSVVSKPPNMPMQPVLRKTVQMVGSKESSQIRTAMYDDEPVKQVVKRRSMSPQKLRPSAQDTTTITIQSGPGVKILTNQPTRRSVSEQVSQRRKSAQESLPRVYAHLPQSHKGAIGLRENIDSVSHFFAWNDFEDGDNDDKVSGETYIP